MRFLQQTWTLAKKDLIIMCRRRWLSTLIRALLFPVIFTIVIANIKIWTQTSGGFGIGQPSPVRSLPDALAAGSPSRNRFVIVDNGFKDGDIATVIGQLSNTVKASGKDLRMAASTKELNQLCPSSTGGVSTCFAAVSFGSSPTNTGYNNSRLWNYTIYTDSGIRGIDVTSNSNGLQIYTLPLQRAIDSSIASIKGVTLPEVDQFPFTTTTEEEAKAQENEEFQSIVFLLLGFAFFVGLSGSIYHLTGHVCHQRETKMLQLIDAMMPNKSPWECISARVLAAHLAFTIVYLPGWIIMGASLPVIIFPHTNPGWILLLYILTGLAVNSYSLLASSLFKRVRLSASLAIIFAFIFALVAQLAVGDNAEYHDGFVLNGAVVALSLVFPPSAFCFVLMRTASFEAEEKGLDPNGTTDYIRHWNITASELYACFLFSIFLYPILAIIIEKYMWGTSSKTRIVSNGEKLGGAAVRIHNFTKKYKSLVDKKQTVVAVDDLTLDIPAGAITVLLGANGSGKSTTLSAIAGVETITDGTIEIDGTGGLGLCPQANILYPVMTVRDHVDFFEALKNTSRRTKAERNAEVDRIIEGCDLTIKRDAMAKTLSGGQKRKLQLAMMLAGGSRVCCIDEASSGIDPIARRKVWDILRAERGRRSLLFTTHFLDEAEGLSDHVAILSKGVLKAEGSVAALKNELGGGYQVVLQDSAVGAQIPQLPGVTAKTDYNWSVYSMPNPATLAQFVEELEKRNIQSYRVEGPTVEKVFLALAEEMQGDSDLAKELRMVEDEGAAGGPVDSPTVQKRRALNLKSGKALSPIQQTGVLLYKRLVVLKHNYMPYIAALALTLAMAGLVLRLFLNPEFERQYGNGFPCSDPGTRQTGLYASSASKSYFANNFVYGPPDRVSVPSFIAALPDQSFRGGYYSSYNSAKTQNVSSAATVDSLQAWNDYIAAKKTQLYEGGLYNDTSKIYIAWEGSAYSGGYAAAELQAVVDGIALNETINFGSGYFQPSYSASSSIGTFVVILTTLGFAIYPGFMSLYVTAERLRNVRQMHYSNGILSSSVWAAHAIFDLCFVLLISICTTAIWVSLWHGWYAPGYMFVVLFLYGIASVTFSYIVSLFVSSQLAAFAFSAVIQVIISMLYFLGYLLTTVNAAPDQIYTWFNYIHYTIALICPAASLERALFMTLNQYSLSCTGNQLATYPGEMRIYGAPILYLTVQFLLFSAFLMFWEGGRSLEVFGIRTGSKKKESKDLEKIAALRTQNPDAIEADDRLATENTGLRVENVSKTFGSNTAVDQVTFGILPSEKFALLGPNGAGKSTMISLIRGDIKSDSSRDGSAIHIASHNLRTAPLAARSHLGVCPQFDAIDSMTLLEHLRFYARARGVPDREANIDELMRRFGLYEHKNKMAKKLSGGTKRKLSLAIALIANPEVLLLDEPSSGMDPAAKRALWSTLSAISEGRVLLMTTHSMEEADALCDRAGIMASRMLALGSMGELRQRHGNAAFIHLVHKDAPYTTSDQMSAMNSWVEKTFPTAIVEQRNFGGQMRFSVPQGKIDNPEIKTGRLFRLIEHVKGDIGVSDYSIGPATLDQVFLNVVGKHDVKEENTEIKKGFLAKMFKK